MRIQGDTRTDDLIRRLDLAVVSREDSSCCRAVKQALVEVLGDGAELLDAAMLRPGTDRYARRLLHRDPAGRYTVLVMVWNPGQGTELHDHAGMWCVECVHRGRIEVTSYSIRGGDADQGLVQFARETSIVAGIGEAGALIPPFEYHRIDNPFDVPAVTLHVYGGEMTHCHVFTPVEGGAYRRQWRELSYTD
jgi:predicted metal-dependent enzyme (double-stranded beta helix superfamily)